MFVIALQISVSNLPPVPGAGVTESNNGGVFMIQFFMLSLKYGNKLDWVSRAEADQGGTSYSQANILKLIRKHWPQNKIGTVTQLELYDCILSCTFSISHR